MENTLNAECVICGSKYHCCLSCKEQKAFRPWRTVTDSIEHYKLFLTLSDYNNKKITKSEAKEQLGKINYIFNELRDNIQKTVLEITEEKEIQIKKKTSEK